MRDRAPLTMRSPSMGLLKARYERRKFDAVWYWTGGIDTGKWNLSEFASESGTLTDTKRELEKSGWPTRLGYKDRAPHSHPTKLEMCMSR